MTDASNDDLQRIKGRIEKSLLRLLASESDDDTEKNWLKEHASDSELKRLVPHITILGLHALDVISEGEGVRAVDIAKELGVTKGAISKTTRKLLDHGLIKREKRPDNLKEIYYYVTPLGAELAKLHRQLHQEKDQRALELFRGYDLESLKLIAEFMEKLARLR